MKRALNIRFDDEEMKRIKEAARKADETVSTFVRSATMDRTKDLKIDSMSVDRKLQRLCFLASEGGPGYHHAGYEFARWIAQQRIDLSDNKYQRLVEWHVPTRRRKSFMTGVTKWIDDVDR